MRNILHIVRTFKNILHKADRKWTPFRPYRRSHTFCSEVHPLYNVFAVIKTDTKPIFKAFVSDQFSSPSFINRARACQKPKQNSSCKERAKQILSDDALRPDLLYSALTPLSFLSSFFKPA